MNNNDLIRKYLGEFSSVADEWFEKATFLEVRFNFFNNFFKKEHLNKIEWNEIQKLGDNLHCFSTNALAKKRAFGSLNHKIEQYRESFYYLAFGSDEPRKRIDSLSDKNGKYRLKFISDSAISELISYIMPDKYTFFNSRSRKALSLLGVSVKSEKNETLGDKFEYFSEAIKPINVLYKEIVGKKTNLPLSFEIDQFFSFLYEKFKDELEGNENNEKVNFWVFQGNPKIYDVSRALNDNMIHEWWVKSHKDKINIGDKGIIWVTGQESGCYAFFKVITEIYEANEDEDQEQYYRTEMKNEINSKIGIEIEKNISTSPILKESVKNLDWFQDFNGGNQGTTFQMTKKEYEGFLDMSKVIKKPTHWMIGCGDGGEFWDEFQALNRISIGWVELEDHRKFKSKEEVESEYLSVYKPERRPTNNSLCIWEFSNELKKGDIVFVKKGRTHFLAAAMITSDKAEYDRNKVDHKMYLSVEWLKKKDHELEDTGVALKSLTKIDKYPDFVKKLRNIYGLDIELFQNNFKGNGIMKNTILFGPPGTGKTYNTINKAVAIANPSFNQSLGREAVKEEYHRLVNLGQIVFTTFHQSMSYEDFIEGIKPVEPEEGESLTYKVELGIFRKLCIEAAFDIIQSKNIQTSRKILDFSSMYDKFIEDVSEKLENKKNIELRLKSGGTVVIESISEKDNLKIKHTDGSRHYTVSKNRLSKLYAAIPNLNDVENINTKFREIIGGSNSSAYWAVLNAINENRSQFDKAEIKTKFSFVEKVEVVSQLTNSEYMNVSGKPFVIIIDEINRGNISQIFGELITLIEDDKRLGCPEALELTLPYSKSTFGVPSNVYILGTMNTADRSVEALDTALRRRFSFEEMSPDLVELRKNKIFDDSDIDLVDILSALNKRIEKLLNKDHLIGHSFFMNVKNISDLKLVFKNKIIPLLQEYFYGDVGKIGLVLGAGFVKLEDESKDNVFATFEGYEFDDLNSKPIYKFTEVGKLSDQSFKEALFGILKK